MDISSADAPNPPTDGGNTPKPFNRREMPT